MNHSLEITVLGKPRIIWQGQALTADVISAKGQALLVYLAVTGQTCSRQFISGLLWGDLPEERARGNLRLTLSKLRNVLGDYLITARQSLAFDTACPHWLDTAEFIRYCTSPEKTDFYKLEAAAGLYRGNFLDDFYLHDAPDFETWVMVERERFQQMATASLFQLARAAYQQNEIEKSIGFTRHSLSLEPWREEAHQQLMKLLVQSGQRSAALNQFEICRRQLGEELGVEPSAETKILYEKIRSGQVGEADGFPIRPAAPALDASAGKAASHLRHNLPQQLTPFLGREPELTQIVELLSKPECRLLTLIGPGGIGKTRLSLEAARTQVKHFRDGVRFLSFRGSKPADPLGTTELLITTIANVVDYAFSAQRSPRELLLEHLADKELLLLLDNFESLLSAQSSNRAYAEQFILDILKQCPAIKILITSRERINIQPEWLLEVNGLPYPPTIATDAAKHYPAVELFVQQARRVDPNFTIDDQSYAVHRICQLVAGFPLGIELAANWVHLMTCAEIAERLDHDAEILTPSPLESSPSLRSVLDSTWELLNEQEQQVFRCLSVFRGAFALTAAEQVANASLPILQSLRSKSMLRRDDKGRYTLHELLSQFGSYRLKLSPDQEKEVQQKYGHFYGRFLQARRSALKDPFDQSTMTSIDAEIENIRAALDWFFKQGDTEMVTLYVDSIWPYYQRKGWFQETAIVLERACALEEGPALQKAYWHHWLGEAYFNLGKFSKSTQNLEYSLRLLGYPIPIGSFGLFLRGAMEALKQVSRQMCIFRPPALDLAEAEKRLEAVRVCERLTQIYWFQSQLHPIFFLVFFALNLAETVGDSPELARIYGNAAVGMSLSPLSAVTTNYLKRGVEMAQALDDPSTLAWVCEDAGLVHLGRGEWNEAKEALETSAATFRQIGDHRHWEEATGLLGEMAHFQGRFADAQTIQKETLTSARKRGDVQFQFHELIAYATNAMRLGELSEAMEVLKEARCLTGENNGLVEEIRFHGVSAQVYLQKGETDAARKSAQLAMERMLRTRPTAFYALEGYAGVSDVYLAALENDHSTEMFQSAGQAIKLLHQFGQILRIGQPRAWLHQGLYDWAHGRHGKAFQAWEKSLRLAGQISIPCEAARAHFEIGRHLPVEDPARLTHLQKAVELFSQMGTTYDLTRAQSVLEVD